MGKFLPDPGGFDVRTWVLYIMTGGESDPPSHYMPHIINTYFQEVNALSV